MNRCSVDFECSSVGYFVKPNSNNKHYFHCIKIKDGSFFPQNFSCSTNEEFNEAERKCANIVTNKTKSLFNCEKSGRFFKADSDCNEYYLCIVSENQILKEIYPCPNGTKFSTSKLRCIRSQECQEESQHECHRIGKFINFNSKKCSNYVQCVKAETTFKRTIVDCPPDTRFSHTKLRCEKDGYCPFIELPASELCKNQIGRFLYNEDLSGQSYILCTTTKNAIGDKFITSQIYKCPIGTRFSAKFSYCERFVDTISNDEFSFHSRFYFFT